MARQHAWVEMKYTPIEVEPQLDGSIHVHATEAAIEIAHEEALNGCWFCFTPLTPESLGTDCPYDPAVGRPVPGVGDQPGEAQRPESPGDGAH